MKCKRVKKDYFQDSRFTFKMHRKHPQTPLSPRARTMTPLALLHAAGAAATTGTAATAAAQQWPSLDEAAKVPSSIARAPAAH